jgi:membrane-bound ClpP family serine protease
MTDEQPDPKSGARGTVLTEMLPGGKVEIDGTEYQARCRGGWADRGDDIVVVGLDAFGLIVDKTKPLAD